jgi:hypothetical protein
MRAFLDIALPTPAPLQASLCIPRTVGTLQNYFGPTPLAIRLPPSATPELVCYAIMPARRERHLRYASPVSAVVGSRRRPALYPHL